MRRVTLKDIAEAVGLSISCTARAMKGRPDISAETCRRVREAAERLGYSADPLLTALSAYRQSQKPARFRGTLGFLAPRDDEKTWLDSRETGDLLRGARARAESLGYRMEYFTLGGTREAQRRLAKTMWARGIKGFLIRSFPLAIAEIDLPFDQFECISLFSEPHTGQISTVSSYHAQAMELTLQKLLSRGIRHPALVLGRGVSRAIHHGWSMAFQVYAAEFDRVSIFHIEDDLGELYNAARQQAVPGGGNDLDRWVSKKNPGALIFCTSENLIPARYKSKRQERTAPAIICMDLLDPECGLPGIYQNRSRGAAAAVDWLQSMLISAQPEKPRLPNAMMIPGTWIDSSGLPC